MSTWLRLVLFAPIRVGAYGCLSSHKEKMPTLLPVLHRKPTRAWGSLPASRRSWGSSPASTVRLRRLLARWLSSVQQNSSRMPIHQNNREKMSYSYGCLVVEIFIQGTHHHFHFSLRSCYSFVEKMPWRLIRPSIVGVVQRTRLTAWLQGSDTVPLKPVGP